MGSCDISVAIVAICTPTLSAVLPKLPTVVVNEPNDCTPACQALSPAADIFAFASSHFLARSCAFCSSALSSRRMLLPSLSNLASRSRSCETFFSSCRLVFSLLLTASINRNKVSSVAKLSASISPMLGTLIFTLAMGFYPINNTIHIFMEFKTNANYITKSVISTF